jgi:hypothetical protein
MKALAETFPVPGHTNGRGLDQYLTRRGHRAGSTARRRTVQKPDSPTPIYHRCLYYLKKDGLCIPFNKRQSLQFSSISSIKEKL